jgi:hypothetical protein
MKAPKNIVKSGYRYLLVISYPLTLTNYDIYDGDCKAFNLF